MPTNYRQVVSFPEVLLLDEPSAGLSPKFVSETMEAVSRVRDSGVSVVLVEQNVAAAKATSENRNGPTFGWDVLASGRAGFKVGLPLCIYSAKQGAHHDIALTDLTSPFSAAN